MEIQNLNYTIENTTISKDISGILNNISSEQILSIESQKHILNENQNSNMSKEQLSQAEANPVLKQKFSSLVVLMRKAQKMLLLFDNKIKLITNKKTV